MTLILVIAMLIILVMALSAMMLRNLRKRQSKAPLPAPLNDNTAANSQILKLFDAAQWAQMNEWLFEGQADDRRPMLSNLSERIGSASAFRSTSRRSQQESYKEWSKQRHD